MFDGPKQWGVGGGGWEERFALIPHSLLFANCNHQTSAIKSLQITFSHVIFTRLAVVKSTDFHLVMVSALIFSLPPRCFVYFNTCLKSLSNENTGRDIGKDAASLLRSQPSWDLNQHGSAAIPRLDPEDDIAIIFFAILAC